MFKKTKSIDLRDLTPHRVVLADGTAATVRQSATGHVSVTKGREEIASATILNGVLINLRVNDFYANRGIGDLLNRSLKRAAGVVL